MKRRTFQVTERSLHARRLAVALMLEHGLGHLSFAFNGSKRYLGLYVKKNGEPERIELSIHLCELASEADLRDTILHEIAHALCGIKAGHGPVWRAKARELGAVPRACSGKLNIPQGNWAGTCPGCGHVYYRYRKPRSFVTYYCVICPRRARRLVWQTRNGQVFVRAGQKFGVSPSEGELSNAEMPSQELPP